MPASTPPTFTEHYLQVQALTPTSSSTEPEPTIPTLSYSTIIFPLLIFISIFSAGIIAYLATRIKNKSYLSNALKLALALAIIPLGLGVVGLRTELRSQAGPNHIPTTIAISPPTSTSFTLTFTTKAPSNSGAQISLTSSMDSITQTLFSNPNSPSISHHYTFSHLQPHTSYYLRIYSEGQWYNHQGQPLTILTLP